MSHRATPGILRIPIGSGGRISTDVCAAGNVCLCGSRLASLPAADRGSGNGSLTEDRYARRSGSLWAGAPSAQPPKSPKVFHSSLVASECVVHLRIPRSEGFRAKRGTWIGLFVGCKDLQRMQNLTVLTARTRAVDSMLACCRMMEV